jgi:hypothetical protein
VTGEAGQTVLKNLDGKMLTIPHDMVVAGEFVDGLARAKDVQTGLFGFIDSSLQWVIKPEFEHAMSFSEGMAFVKFQNRPKDLQSRKCFIDLKGEVVIELDGSVQGSQGFYCGVASLSTSAGRVIIDRDGAEVWAE